MLNFFSTLSQIKKNTNSIEEVDYHILYGQSNARGKATTSELVGDLAYLSGQMVIEDNTALINNKGASVGWETMEAGQNTGQSIGEDYFGIQPKLAYEMLNYKNDDFRLIQCTYGGTVIENYMYGTANFTWITDTVRDARNMAKAEGRKARFKSVIWIQGESNGGDGSGIYEGKLRQLGNELRAYLQEPNLLFIIVQMIDCQTGVTNLSFLQDAQAIVGGETGNALVAKGSGPQTCRDTLHFSTEKYMDTADEIFELINNL